MDNGRGNLNLSQFYRGIKLILCSSIDIESIMSPIMFCSIDFIEIKNRKTIYR
ncbi:hypothetical protein GGQ92_002102 [Gracilibacillus halotolerans]|uniref:Uncharacterized protein n=1 Tax=Gracilibacillus halotolerans TaxID=74386 RepID=A0A841RQ28_9BACI|nr:hypothetical protein [Gracilibacillus halotolerans]